MGRDGKGGGCFFPSSCFVRVLSRSCGFGWLVGSKCIETSLERVGCLVLVCIMKRGGYACW